MIAPHIPLLTRLLRANRCPPRAKTLQSIEPKIRAAGEFARGAELDEPIEQATRRAIGQEASAIFRRKAIYEELHPETKYGSDRKSDQVRNLQSCSFVESTAAATRRGASTISRANSRAKALGDDLGTVTGKSLDKGVELDALAKLPKDERKVVIDHRNHWREPPRLSGSKSRKR